MRRFIVSPSASNDLNQVWDFIARDNVEAADSLLDDFDTAAISSSGASARSSPFTSVSSIANKQYRSFPSLIRGNVMQKWMGHEINSQRFVPPPRPMYAIGG